MVNGHSDIFGIKPPDVKSRTTIFSSNNDPEPLEPPKDGCAMARTPAAIAGLAKEGPHAAPRFLPVLVISKFDPRVRGKFGNFLESGKRNKGSHTKVPTRMRDASW